MHSLGNRVLIVRKSSPASTWRGFACVLASVFLLTGCAREQPTGTRDPVELVTASREGVAVLVVMHGPEIKISALSPPVLALEDQPVIRLDRGAQTTDSAYFAEAPWIPRGSIRGAGVLNVSFCRAEESFCTVHSYPVEVK